MVGTEERRTIQKIHRRSRVIDGPRPTSGRQSPRPPPQWIWKKVEIKRAGTAASIDWARQRKNIRYPKLYPFLNAIREEHPNREVLLVEDTVPGKGATNHDPRWHWPLEMTSHNIHRSNWPSNSPDLNEIEPGWDYLTKRSKGFLLVQVRRPQIGLKLLS